MRIMIIKHAKDLNAISTIWGQKLNNATHVRWNISRDKVTGVPSWLEGSKALSKELSDNKSEDNT